MWHSLEVRVPFLDHRVVENVARLPAHWKIRGATQKYLLKRIAEKWLPRPILRHRKQGFESPMARWLAGPLRGVVEHYLRADLVERQGLFQRKAIRQLLDQHATGTRQNSKILFSLLMFQLWWSRENP
jgi:asparagine synthase (glutamine-hydrolysing)